MGVIDYKQELTDDFQKKIVDYSDYLKRKELSDRTIKEYCRYFKVLNLIELTQEKADEFLTKTNNNVARAFIKSLADWQGKTIKIPKVTGRRERKLPRVITREDVNKISDKMNNLRNKLMLAITFQGGLRMQEMRSIRPYDFRWDKWKEDIEKTGDLIIRGKGRKERVIYLSSNVMQMAYGYVKKLSPYLTPETPIFPVSQTMWAKILGKASMNALGFHVNPHLLRHSTANYLYADCGWRLEDIKEYLGHKDISTTMIYTRIDKKELKNKFNDAFE